MTKIFSYFFDKGWRPVLFWFISCMIFGISEITGNRILGNIALVFLGHGLLAILISAIYSLTKEKWLTALLNLGLLGGTIAVFIFYSIAMYLIEQERPDEWAKNLTIPTNIPVENPVGPAYIDHKPDSITNRVVLKTDFQLYNSFQPGLYEYDFWTGKIESGTIYLKAFEITQEYALSTNRLPESTSVKIHNTTDRIMKFGTKSHFPIYEGDWGQPYAARFEVWFKPDKGRQERKLFSKIYKIEGWMR
ncbi:MAG: hypothetical protein K1X92_14205 [Bacteroidia bacterium]|nr:hypothetical protein [Bacteroidia bacterium]